MRVRIEHRPDVEEEIVIYCQEENEEINKLKQYLSLYGDKICGIQDGKEFFIHSSEILYVESVDGSTYAYTSNQVYKVSKSLDSMGQKYSDIGFFRCSKSMIVNLEYIERLQSEMGNRIVAYLKNQEKIVISRHYASKLRALLKVGGER